MLTATMRQWQFDQLRKSVKVIGYVVQHTTQLDATTYHDGGQGWTALEVMGHLLDFEEVFLQRAKFTVEQDYPELPFPNPDELVRAGNYNSRNLQDVYTAWTQRRETLLRYLDGLNETDWERAGKHPTRGHLTLNSQLLVMVWHDMNHLEQVTHILTEKAL